MYLNKVFLLGNLTRDPEERALPSGTKVVSFGLATNRRYKDTAGAWQEATEYHNVVVFGRQGEVAAQYLKKGDMVLVEGRLQTRSWERDGQKQYRTEIVAERVQFGPRGGKGAATAPQEEEVAEALPPVEDEIDPEDIPF